jgi:hypothetical protein
LIFSAYCRAKAAEDSQLAWIDARLVLRVPLHGKYESPVLFGHTLSLSPAVERKRHCRIFHGGGDGSRRFRLK